MGKNMIVTAIAGGAAIVALAGCTPGQVSAWKSSQNSGGSAAAWAAGAGPTRVRNCESGNNYSTNTGNGYYGAWQFDLSSWYANGGGSYASRPDLAPKWAQDQVAYNYWKRAGWSPWACKP